MATGVGGKGFSWVNGWGEWLLTFSLWQTVSVGSVSLLGDFSGA